MRARFALLALLAAVGLAAGASLTTGNAANADRDPEQTFMLHQDPMPSKMAWPELVGTSAEQAKASLEAELPGKRIILVRQGSLMTMDFSLDRVRIIYNPETGLVVSPPRIG